MAKLKPIIPLKIYADEKEDKEDLIEAINTLYESEHGKKVLDFAKEKKIKIYMTNGCDESGYYDEDKRQVVLSSDYFDESYGIFTLAHELRHAVQYDTIDYDDSDLDIKSQLMLNRATEADAMAYCHLCALELKDLGHKDIWKDVKGDLKTISKPMEKAKKENPNDLGKIMKEGFDGWYESKFLLKEYESDILEFLDDIKSDEETYTNEELCTKKVSSKKAMTDICKIDGKYYIAPESKIIEQEKYLGVSENFVKKVSKFFEKREKDTGLASDKSAGKLPIRQKKSKTKTKPAPSITKALISAKSR
jgi:hypothetical protein